MTKSSSSTSLPPVHETASKPQSDSFYAYQLCLDLERGAQSNEDVVYARVLGYLLLLAPSAAVLQTTTAVNRVEREVKSTGPMQLNSVEVLLSISSHRLSTTTTTESKNIPIANFLPSPETWRLHTSLITLGFGIRRLWDQLTISTFLCHIEAFIRDGRRDVLGGSYDRSVVYDPSVDREELNRARITVTHMVHFVPPSKDLLNDQARNHSVHASLLAILQSFGYKPGSPGCFLYCYHSLGNVITVNPTRRYYFFTPFQHHNHEADTYGLETIHPYMRVPGLYPHGTTITFSTPDPVNLPTPSAQLIGLLALVSRLDYLSASGAGDLIEELEEQMKGFKPMEEDGDPEGVPPSAEVLNYAFARPKRSD
ncbi:hypothetical protein D9758_003381 [Tetrapyrgos nigripes]|uniref:HNH nuclease domain-containing protein n=1 Tax=Tetrapyrgos nigripes TaxID=182062 RepID=A0A8H5LWE4_9AGAR|nr:hypothetical protein D9758_003381 [Tetrapyrgos nigripes]